MGSRPGTTGANSAVRERRVRRHGGQRRGTFEPRGAPRVRRVQDNGTRPRAVAYETRNLARAHAHLPVACARLVGVGAERLEGAGHRGKPDGFGRTAQDSPSGSGRIRRGSCGESQCPTPARRPARALPVLLLGTAARMQPQSGSISRCRALCGAEGSLRSLETRGGDGGRARLAPYPGPRGRAQIPRASGGAVEVAPGRRGVRR